MAIHDEYELPGIERMKKDKKKTLLVDIADITQALTLPSNQEIYKLRKVIRLGDDMVSIKALDFYLENGCQCSSCSMPGNVVCLVPTSKPNDCDYRAELHGVKPGKPGGGLVKMSRDHRIPVAMGGSNERWNLQPMCVICNMKKDDKLSILHLQAAADWINSQRHLIIAGALAKPSSKENERLGAERFFRTLVPGSMERKRIAIVLKLVAHTWDWYYKSSAFFYQLGNQVSFLLKKLPEGADMDISIDRKGSSALSLAVQLGDAWLAKTLMTCKASPDCPDFGGRTPLHHAAMRQDMEMCRLLLSYRADPFLPDIDGKTAIDMVPDERLWKDILYSYGLIDRPGDKSGIRSMRL